MQSQHKKVPSQDLCCDATELTSLVPFIFHCVMHVENYTCSLCMYMPGAPSSTHWPRGQADSCQHEWDGSGHFCDLAAL